jgi:hypothetical protein
VVGTAADSPIVVEGDPEDRDASFSRQAGGRLCTITGMSQETPIDLSATQPNPELKFTEGFKDPDETAPWWLLNFYLELPFYFPYLDGAKFNINLHQEKWATPAPADLPEPPFVLLAVIQTSVPAPVEPSPAMALTMRKLLHDRAKGILKTAFDAIPPRRALHIASIIEAVTPKVLLQSEADAGLPHDPTTYVNRCLYALNLWIRSLAFLTQESSIRTIQAENLPQYGQPAWICCAPPRVGAERSPTTAISARSGKGRAR